MPWIRVLTFIFLAVPMLEAIEWVQEPQNKEILPGGRVVLACQVSGEYQSINWLGKTSALDTELIFIKNGRDGAVQGWKPLEGFKIQNAFDLVIEVSENFQFYLMYCQGWIQAYQLSPLYRGPRPQEGPGPLPPKKNEGRKKEKDSRKKEKKKKLAEKNI